MKKRYLFATALLVATATAQAQDTYLNERIAVTDDLNGSARYVAMGGALGALGADLSVMSSNPAGMALYRKSDLGLTFGVVMPHGNGWDTNEPSTYGENLARASFDQMGFVWSMNCGNDCALRYMNFGVNYQKKKNFNSGFFADNNNLCGLSQMGQLANLANLYADYVPNNLTGLATLPCEREPDRRALSYDETDGYYNEGESFSNQFTHHSRGSLQLFDFNLAFNINDRFYTGITLGAENVDYRSWSEYAEFDADGITNNHQTYNDRDISGYGVNVKFGFIARPMEENPFRVGLAIETPTWYRLRNSSFYSLSYQVNEMDENGEPVQYVVDSDKPESVLEYTLRTPWKLRLSAGTTIGTQVAIGAEYEFANYGRMSQGYPLDDPYLSEFAGEPDLAMNQHMRQTLKGQHVVRLGVEYKPISKVALRAGYNFISSTFRKGCSFDQYDINSPAMDYAVSTDFMRLSPTHIATLGVGYKHKKFYADLTYKLRLQSGDFYAFDASYYGGITAVPVNLNTHQVMLGMGFKF